MLKHLCFRLSGGGGLFTRHISAREGAVDATFVACELMTRLDWLLFKGRKKEGAFEGQQMLGQLDISTRSLEWRVLFSQEVIVDICR